MVNPLKEYQGCSTFRNHQPHQEDKFSGLTLRGTNREQQQPSQ